MKGKSQLGALIIASIVLTGCATMNKSECLTADWRNVGQDDAQSGNKLSYLAQHQKACVKHGVSADSEEYTAGWQAGIQQFCTAESGWRYGSAGKYYRNTCNAAAEPAFLEAFTLAKSIYSKKAEVSRQQRRLETLVDKLVSDKLTKEERLELANERIQLKLEIELVEVKLSYLIKEARAKGFSVY